MKFSAVIKFMLILLLFAGTGCEETTIDPLFKESTFRINQLYTSSDGIYKFKITDVNDSRCPEGAQCIWAGEVYLKGEWIENKDTTEVELHSLLTDQQKLPEGITMKIMDAKPYPKSGTPTDPEDLELSLLIQKK